MKKVYKILQVFLISVMILGFSNVGVRDVEAAVPSIEKNATYNLYKGTSYTKFLYINNPRKNGKITHLKNSNPKVVTVAAGNPYSFLEISPKREGKAKITFRYAGKTLSQTITVKKYENPCQSFKIGNIDYTRFFNKSGHFIHNRRKKDYTGVIKIKPKKGCEVVKIKRYDMYNGGKTIKNGKKITLSIAGTGTGVDVYFKNIKTGEKKKLTLGYSSSLLSNLNIYD